jgi:hypothetical protein
LPAYRNQRLAVLAARNSRLDQWNNYRRIWPSSRSNAPKSLKCCHCPLRSGSEGCLIHGHLLKGLGKGEWIIRRQALIYDLVCVTASMSCKVISGRVPGSARYRDDLLGTHFFVSASWLPRANCRYPCRRRDRFSWTTHLWFSQSVNQRF